MKAKRDGGNLRKSYSLKVGKIINRFSFRVFSVTNVRLRINNADRLSKFILGVSYRNSFAFWPEATYRKRNEAKPFGFKGGEYEVFVLR